LQSSMRLFLVRHGETTWNVERRTQGRSDIELNDVGLRQAGALANALKHEKVAAVYASPLKRAVVTAQLIADAHGLAVVTHPALQELDQGELEGMQPQEMRQKYPEVLRHWGTGDTTLKLPDGESMAELQGRMWTGLQEVHALHRQDTVVVVSHNLAILAFTCKALGLPLSAFRRLRLQTGSLTVFDMDEQKGVLLRFNETCHFDGRNSTRAI